MINRDLKFFESEFNVSRKCIKNIISDFHLEMDRGLSGEASSLKMIPSYAFSPTGKETGKFLAIDLGGSNLRVLTVKLLGNGVISPPVSRNFILKKSDKNTTGKKLFRFIALSVKKFLKSQNISLREKMGLGFTFSFPIDQSGIASGRLMIWTKGFNVTGVVNHDIAVLLTQALRREGLCNISVAALINDTVGTLAAGRYLDKDCDMGVIIGTGTNACYLERVVNIRKISQGARHGEEMIINIEWGNFNKLKINRYDESLDKSSNNPGKQKLEKMISGAYLGELCGRGIADLMKSNMILNSSRKDNFIHAADFKAEYVSDIIADRSKDLGSVKRVLKEFGVKRVTLSDRKMARDICAIVARRASRISGAVITAVLLKMDPRITGRHVIAIDGSVYEKLPGFSQNLKSVFREILKDKARKVRIVLTKDGSGRGAGIVAASVGMKTFDETVV